MFEYTYELYYIILNSCYIYFLSTLILSRLKYIIFPRNIIGILNDKLTLFSILLIVVKIESITRNDQMLLVLT